MEIKELHLKNFRGFNELDIKFDSKLAVFIGKNGAGKTSVLDAIAILLTQYILNIDTLSFHESYKKSLDFSLTKEDIKVGKDNVKISITAKLNNSEKYINWSFENSRTKSIRRDNDELKKYFSGSQSSIPIIKYYKSLRTLDTKLEKSPKTKKNLLYGDSIKKGIENFDEFISWFEYLENIENEMRLRNNINDRLPELEYIRKTIEIFFSYLSDANFHNLRVERGYHDLLPVLESTFKITKGKTDLSLEHLSDGEKMVLMLVVDIARKLYILGYENVSERKGIVLIDEIELHLHPTWQREIIPALTKTFPNIQFIVSTHSPQVLSNVDGKDIYVIEDFKLKDNDYYTKGRDSNSILYDVFGEEKRPKEYKEKILELYNYIDKENKEKATKVFKELVKDFGNNDTEIQRALMYLEDLDE